MGIFSWFKLLLLEQRLYHGAFGKYNRYRRYCIERNATTAKEKLAIATEVLSGPNVSPIEAQDNQLYLLFKTREPIYGTESHKLQSLSNLMPTGEREPTGGGAKVETRTGTAGRARFGTESHVLADLSSLTLTQAG